jgi:tryptophan synthase alpha chain
VADGPAIQAADLRSLASGTSTSSAMKILGRIHEARPKTALNLLVYGNLVHQRGFDRFAKEAADAGASSLLVPDVPLEESAPLKKACRAAKLAHVQLVGPLTSAERLVRLDRMADGYLYLVAHQGITGVRPGGLDEFDPVTALIARTAAAVSNPLCVGFGLSNAEQIRNAFEAGARIAVVGSHLATVIGEGFPKGGGHLIPSFATAVQALFPH